MLMYENEEIAMPDRVSSSVSPETDDVSYVTDDISYKFKPLRANCRLSTGL